MAATAVATAQASRLEGGPTLEYRGVEYRDQRCVRLEVLLLDADLEAVVGLLETSGGQAQGDLTVWSSDVDERSGRRPLAGVAGGAGRA